MDDGILKHLEKRMGHAPNADGKCENCGMAFLSGNIPSGEALWKKCTNPTWSTIKLVKEYDDLYYDDFVMFTNKQPEGDWLLIPRKNPGWREFQHIAIYGIYELKDWYKKKGYSQEYIAENVSRLVNSTIERYEALAAGHWWWEYWMLNVTYSTGHDSASIGGIESDATHPMEIVADLVSELPHPVNLTESQLQDLADGEEIIYSTT